MKKKVFLALGCLLFILPGAQLAALDVNYAEALQKSIYFYDANMCGPDAAEASALEWRGDCHIWDVEAPHPYDTGETIDVSGGFHDCGDHVKFGQPQVYAIATLGWGYYEFKDAFSQTGQEDHILNVLKWGTDYLLRCTEFDTDGDVRFFVYMVGEGSSDHVNWIAPELQTYAMDSRPIDISSPETPASDVVGGAVASLALMYLNYQSVDAAYAQQCLDTAVKLYEFGCAYPGLSTGDGFYNPTAYQDDMTWGATWLYVATGDSSYIDDIIETDASGNYTGFLSGISASTANTWQNIWVHCWNAAWGGAFTKLATLFPENEQFNYFARWNLEYWTGGAVPHADSADGNYLEPTAAGYAMIDSWGSARYNTAAQLCMLVYNKYYPQEGAALVEWARGQMEYILGENPMGYSYLVGYPSVEESAQHPHHRAAHGSAFNDMNNPEEHTHVLWGALVGGPDSADYHEDITSDYVFNEVGVDYNAACVGALAGHYLLWDDGDAAIPDFPPSEGNDPEYYIEARMEQETSRECQMTMKIYNMSTRPPHYQSGIKARYYFNISELIDAGQSINDVTITVMYDQLMIYGAPNALVEGPIAHDADAGIYYVEFTWEYEQWYGGLELMFAIIATQDSSYQENLDASNDYSRQGLTSVYTSTTNIPVYLDGELMYGTPPDGGDATPTPTPTGDITCYLFGDVNGDSNVTIVDALMVAQYYVSLVTELPNELCADVNCDGVINIVDALVIAQYYVGLISDLGC